MWRKALSAIALAIVAPPIGTPAVLAVSMLSGQMSGQPAKMEFGPGLRGYYFFRPPSDETEDQTRAYPSSWARAA
ncbi:MAG: hypothetical protein KDA35_07680 [Hyphomonadaceae bacterium]|nr:hypothetical protein [Hyphomonadaceae bacterium]